MTRIDNNPSPADGTIAQAIGDHGVLLEQFAQLGDRLRALIENEEYEGLPTLLDEREAMIERVHASVRRLAGTANADPAGYEANLPQFDQLDDRLDALLDQASRDEAMLRARYEQIGRRLAQIATTRRAASAYAGPAAGAAKFQDGDA
ncbi:MAG: hypothetical protein JSR77_08765 [Planctomycetes bacterium]|nr:hypothetical protein [Planctomycetota bacterium]